MMDNPIARTSETTTVAKRRSKQTSGRDLEAGDVDGFQGALDAAMVERLFEKRFQEKERMMTSSMKNMISSSKTQKGERCLGSRSPG